MNSTSPIIQGLVPPVPTPLTQDGKVDPVAFDRIAEHLHASGIDAAKLPACLAGGFADSVLLQKLYPRIHARAFDPPIGYARQLSKDLQAVHAFAQTSGCDLPLVQEAATRYAAYVEKGGAMADSASIIVLYETLAAASGKKKTP